MARPDFNPPTPCGVGPNSSGYSGVLIHFNPPTPCGVGLLLRKLFPLYPPFQSTHPVWGGTAHGHHLGSLLNISIHPPRVGWDSECRCSSQTAWNFNPPTPCGVGREVEGYLADFQIFQSTHPVWGGTGHQLEALRIHEISIHPPRVGWDDLLALLRLRDAISIHPPRVGWDPVIPCSAPVMPYFNPPTPCGVGLGAVVVPSLLLAFQSTHPVWGGTFQGPLDIENILFQSTHPVWGGTIANQVVTYTQLISIHPPRVGWDTEFTVSILVVRISIHPPRVGWDL